MGVRFLTKGDREHRYLGGKFTAAPTVIAINYSGTNGCSSNLAVGAYIVTANCACYFLCTNGGATLSNGPTANGHYLGADMRELVRIEYDARNIVATTMYGDGFLHISECK